MTWYDITWHDMIWHDRVPHRQPCYLYVVFYIVTEGSTSTHYTSSHFISSHLISSHRIISYLISSYLITSHLTAPCHATLQAWPFFASQYFFPIPPNHSLHSRYQRKRNGRVLILTTDSKDEDKILKTSTTAGIISKALREPLKHLK